MQIQPTGFSRDTSEATAPGRFPGSTKISNGILPHKWYTHEENVKEHWKDFAAKSLHQH